jgi:hypothetical protein
VTNLPIPSSPIFFRSPKFCTDLQMKQRKKEKT